MPVLQMLRSTFRRLLALDDPPERTALAFSIGVFIAFSPFLGLHTILATTIAFLFRFNKVAIYSGNFYQQPFSDPGSDYYCVLCDRRFYTGSATPDSIRGHRHYSGILIYLPRITTGKLFRESWQIVWPFTIGAMVLSVVCSLIAYPVTLWLLRRPSTGEQARLN